MTVRSIVGGIEFCYLQHLHIAEQDAAAGLKTIAASAVPIATDEEFPYIVEKVEKQIRIAFAREQHLAFLAAIPPYPATADMISMPQRYSTILFSLYRRGWLNLTVFDVSMPSEA